MIITFILCDYVTLMGDFYVRKTQETSRVIVVCSRLERIGNSLKICKMADYGNIGKLKILFARNLLSRMKRETFFSKAVSAPEVDRLHLLSNGSLLHNRLSLLSGSSKFEDQDFLLVCKYDDRIFSLKLVFIGNFHIWGSRLTKKKFKK